MNTLLTRENFKELCIKRDHNKCVLCPETKNLAVHHIMDRSLFEDGGYYINNGITLCESCHINAENGIYTCNELRDAVQIKTIILPSNLDPSSNYDKWGNILTEELIKYPRTTHLEGSGVSKDDVASTISFESLLGKYITIEEKSDGANSGISFDNNCELLLQCRGHFLKGGRDWPEFDQFKVWANTWKDQLFDVLTNRYIMYGEWMFAFHSVFYDRLPHLFLEFDLYDKKEKVFLSTEARKEILDKANIPIHSVKVIKQGAFFDKKDIMDCIGVSNFVSESSPLELEKLLKKASIPDGDIAILMKLNKDRLMEGLYIKIEEDGIVKDRCKFVRPIFVQTILDYGKHWLDRPTIPNLLSPDANMFAMKV